MKIKAAEKGTAREKCLLYYGISLLPLGRCFTSQAIFLYVPSGLVLSNI
jgi:hypothetical protein